MAQKALRIATSGRHSVRNHTYNSKTKGHIKTFYLSNYCSTVGDIYPLHYSCMRDTHCTIGDLWNQTRIMSTFGYDILCLLTLVTRKLQVVCGSFTYRTTALLSDIYIFCVRARCEMRMVIYASKHASESLSTSHLCILTHILKSTGPIRTFRISNDSSTIEKHSL